MEEKHSHLHHHHRHHVHGGEMNMSDKYKEVLSEEGGAAGFEAAGTFESVDDFTLDLGEEFGAEAAEESVKGGKLPEEPARGRGKPSRREKRRAQKNKKKKITPFRVILTILLILLLLMIAVVAIAFIMRQKGKKEMNENLVAETIAAPEEAEIEDEGKVVIYKGEKYRMNEDLTTVLCMGIDTSKEAAEQAVVGEKGQADALFLAVIDQKTGKLTFVSLNRDTMANVRVYNVDGEYVGTEKEQICLAYANGDSEASSAMNVVHSVSGLMYGIPINGYAAIEYNGVAAMNDAMGGIEVQVLEDMTAVDPELYQGANVTLQGYQAVSYIRKREISFEGNLKRMARQRQYLTAFLKKTMKGLASNLSLVVTLYETASEYMVTNLGIPEVTYLATLLLQHGFTEPEMITTPGEVKVSEDGIFAEFHPDMDALYEIVLKVFYTKVQ